MTYNDYSFIIFLDKFYISMITVLEFKAKQATDIIYPDKLQAYCFLKWSLMKK